MRARSQGNLGRQQSPLLYQELPDVEQDGTVNWFRFERDVKMFMKSLDFDVEHVAGLPPFYVPAFVRGSGVKGPLPCRSGAGC